MHTRFLIVSLFFLFLSSNLLSQSIEKPEVLKFGETKAKIMLDIDPMCKILQDKQIDPVKLPTAKTTQSQLDCERFSYAGKKRDMELIFADGVLDMIWMLTHEDEEQVFIDGFTALYGKPTHVNEGVTFFLNNGVAVRNDPHEVLFISDRLKPHYKTWMEKKD